MKAARRIVCTPALPGLVRAEGPFVAGLGREGAEPPAGAVLAGELGRVACHASGQPAFAPKAGPDLSAAGPRANGTHLRRFVANPSGVKPGTTLPGVPGHLPDAQREAAALALAHHLASLATPVASPLSAPEAAGRGRVERSFGEGSGRASTFERAYALTSPMEYFAETTEAYFTRNDFFPFTRAELKQHDPEMFALLETLRGVPATK